MLEKLIVVQLVKTTEFSGIKVSLPYSQKTASGTFPNSI